MYSLFVLSILKMAGMLQTPPMEQIVSRISVWVFFRLFDGYEVQISSCCLLIPSSAYICQLLVHYHRCYYRVFCLLKTQQSILLNHFSYTLFLGSMRMQNHPVPYIIHHFFHSRTLFDTKYIQFIPLIIIHQCLSHIHNWREFP